eukprot:770753-Alexandrium_andersonii.AAC.1
MKAPLAGAVSTPPGRRAARWPRASPRSSGALGAVARLSPARQASTPRRAPAAPPTARRTPA